MAWKCAKDEESVQEITIMEFDAILTYIFTFLNLVPFICFFGYILLAFPLIVWYLSDEPALQQTGGNLKRGIKIWSQPLTTEQFNYFQQLQENIIESPKYSWGKSNFIQKQDSQILIFAPNDISIPIRTVHYFGYIDLLSPSPVLEFRSSLPYHLLLLLFSIFLFALVIIVFGINFTIEKQSIESFITRKISEYKIWKLSP